MNNHAIIVGIKEYALTNDERDYLKKYKPVGVILFSRNIFEKLQVKYLVDDIKNIIGSNVLIMIDQEGGKVSRLTEKFWPKFPPANYFGNIAKKNLELAKKETFKNYYLIGKELNKLGINVNCAPVLDLLVKNSSKIIGSRSFSRNAKIVSALGLEACNGLEKASIYPVIKHIPGHGRAKEDSHKILPVVSLKYYQLKDDFLPFKNLKNVYSAMTAHIKYEKLDSKNCVTHSKYIINNIIRKDIGFKGILFSDDLCMKALKGSYYSRAKKAISAGCNVVLHCDYSLKHIVSSTLGAGKISKVLKKKLFR